jgi:hypothetical protein
MIDAKDLMIGNWVSLDGNYSRVEFIEPEEINGNERLDPIPLTQDILYKCGFDKSPQIISIYEQGLLRLWLGHNGCIAYLIDKNSRESHYIKDVQHLHALQNLYFALTGENLNIQL